MLMRAFIQEFKSFIARGNVMDLAVGVIIGGAFKGITDSLVNDILNRCSASSPGTMRPWLACLSPAGGGDLMLAASQRRAQLPDYGVCGVLHRQAAEPSPQKEEAAPPPPPKPSAEEALLTEIRDLLKEQKNG